MTQIIGLLGAAGSGKSTIASHLAESYGAKRYSLAGLLKQIAASTLDFEPEQVYGTQEQKETVDPRYGFTPRWFLQRLGTEGVRQHLGIDFWTEQTIARIRIDAPRIAVIEDVRFVNEATILRSQIVPAGLIWQVVAPVKQSSDAGTHASETEWRDAPFDWQIAPPELGITMLEQAVDRAMFSLLDMKPNRSRR